MRELLSLLHLLQSRLLVSIDTTLEPASLIGLFPGTIPVSISIVLSVQIRTKSVDLSFGSFAFFALVLLSIKSFSCLHLFEVTVAMMLISS